MKSFIVKSVLAVCITFCCLFYLDMMYEQKSSDPIAEINVFNFIPGQIQIANVGSSHGQCDFNWTPLTREQGIQTFNFALTSQSYKYDYALLNMHRNDFADNSVLFIPVSYFSFNTEATDPADQEAISIRYYRLLSPRYNPDYSLYKDLVAVRFPVLSAGEKIFDLFKPPVVFPSLSENRQNIVYAAELSGNSVSGTVSDPSVAADPAAAPAPPEEVYGTEKVQEFESKGYARYERHFANKENYFEQDKIQDLMNILDLCQEENITAVLITTPFTVYYNQYVSEEFLSGFYSTIDSIASMYGVNYYDYSHDERFQTNLALFGDADHLNPDGADCFTALLMEEIPELKDYLASLHTQQ